MTRVVITASGAVCAAGMDADTILGAVLEGRSAIGEIRQWDTTGWPAHVAGEVADLNPRALVEDRKLHKLIRRTDLFGLYAAGQAIAAPPSTTPRPRSTATAAASTSARAAATTRTSTTTCR